MNKKRQTILNSSLIPPPSSLDHDVVIAGGGPAGTSAAIHLAMAGARVLLAEQKKFPRAKLCGEFISPECLEHFRRLGVGESFREAGGAHLTETVFYARGGSSVSVPSEWFGVKGTAAAALGLSRAEMDERLLERARLVGVEVLEEAQVTSLVVERGRVCGVELRMNGGSAHTYRSKVTIDATGRGRSLARRFESNEPSGARVHRKSKRAPFVAFKAHLEGARGCEDHCEIYLYRGGYGGLSRIEGGLSNLCFIAQPRDVRACGSDAERVMREVIVAANARAAYTLAPARVCSEWLSVALEGFGRHELVPADGLITVGDAASFIDPFTGSGMLMALESGEIAALAIARWLGQLSDEEAFQRLADDYRARYRQQFNRRLRVSSALRRAAFVPRLAEMTMLAVGASERVRRALARATRPRAKGASHAGPVNF